MFYGNFTHSTDSKGRVSVPAKFRDIIIANDDGKLIVTRWGSFLAAFPINVWEIFLEELGDPVKQKELVDSFPPPVEGEPPIEGDLEASLLIDYVLAYATECVIDRQGRILIPANLRALASIEKELIFVGSRKRINIYSREAWEKADRDATASFNKYGAKLGKFGSR